MKKVLVAVLLMGLAATSFGVANVDWASTYGYYFDTGSGDPGYGILVDGSGAGALAQLIYCGANGVRDGVDQDGNSLGDDVVWQSYTVYENGLIDNGDTYDTYAHFNGAVQNYQQAFSSGLNVYARIFQDDVISGNDWYYYTPTLTLIDITGTMFQQNIEMAPDSMIAINGNGTPMDPTQNSGLAGTAQVIPEPATILLFGIGGMGAWLLRRRQQA